MYMLVQQRQQPVQQLQYPVMYLILVLHQVRYQQLLPQRPVLMQQPTQMQPLLFPVQHTAVRFLIQVLLANCQPIFQITRLLPELKADTHLAVPQGRTAVLQ